MYDFGIIKKAARLRQLFLDLTLITKLQDVGFRVCSLCRLLEY